MDICMCAQLRLSLCYLMDYSPPGSSALEFSRQEYCSRLPFSPPGDFPNLGLQHISLTPPVLASKFFTTELPGKPILKGIKIKCMVFHLNCNILEV